jgi:hypothetical protein
VGRVRGTRDLRQDGHHQDAYRENRAEYIFGFHDKDQSGTIVQSKLEHMYEYNNIKEPDLE